MILRTVTDGGGGHASPRPSIAFPIAYMAARYARGAWKALFYLGIMLPLWASYLVKVYAWKLILAKEGILNWVFEQLHLTWLLDAWLSLPVIGGNSLSISYTGTFLVFLYVWMPYMILPIQAAIERVPTNLIDASADLGATPHADLLEGDLPAGAAGHRRGLDLHLLADAGRLHHPADHRHLALLHRPGGLFAPGHGRQHPAGGGLHRGADRHHGPLSVAGPGAWGRSMRSDPPLGGAPPSSLSPPPIPPLRGARPSFTRGGAPTRTARPEARRRRRPVLPAGADRADLSLRLLRRKSGPISGRRRG